MIHIHHLTIRSYCKFRHQDEEKVLLDPSIRDNLTGTQDIRGESDLLDAIDKEEFSDNASSEGNRGCMNDGPRTYQRSTTVSFSQMSKRDMADQLANKRILVTTCGAPTFEQSRYSKYGPNSETSKQLRVVRLHWLHW